MRETLALLTLSAKVLARGCDSTNPFAAECVKYFGGGGCNNELGSYRPTCEGNCFTADFDSIWASGGEGGKTTGCIAYSDPECQDEVLDTGNQGIGNCQNAVGAKSMKCYYDC